MKKTFVSIFFLVACFSAAKAQAISLPNDCRKILENDFRSWKIADVADDIKTYYRNTRAFEEPNLIKGDWNADGKTDYAVLLTRKDNVEDRIILVLMKAGRKYKRYILSGNDCIMSLKKGKKDHNFDTGKTFRYNSDAIFSYFWEKAGVSYVWEKGKFAIVTTSD